MKRAALLLALAALTLLAAGLRLDGLGRRGFWRDEAQAVVIAQKDFPGGVIEALRHEAHPPLYYSLLHVWMRLVGRTEFRIRLLSALPAILTIPLLFWVGRRLFGVGAGLGAMALGAVSPLHITLAQSARGYTWMGLWALLSLWLLAEAWERGGVWRWAGYVAATAAALYTHNWGLFLVLAQNAFALWRFAGRRGDWKRRLVTWSAVQVVLGLLYLPWVPVLLAQTRIIVVLPFIPTPTPAQKLGELSGALFGPAGWMQALWALLLISGLASPWWNRPVAGSSALRGGLALVACGGLGALALGVLASLATYGQVPAHVTLAALPALVLLAGRGLPLERSPALGALGVVLILVGSLLGGQLERSQYAYKSTLREVAVAVEREAGPNDMIVLAPEYLSPTFNFYFRGSQPQIAFPWVLGRQEWIDCVGWTERWRRAAAAVPATLDDIAARLGPAGRVWLIAAPDDFPDEELYYGQVRRLKAELDARYTLERTLDSFRGAPEWATIYVYGRQP